jgi:hypothetical protein
MIRFAWLYCAAWVRGLFYRWPRPVPIRGHYTGCSCGMVGWRECRMMYSPDPEPDEYGWTGKRWEPWAFRRTTVAGARWSATFRVPMTAEEIEYERVVQEGWTRMADEYYAEEHRRRLAEGPIGEDN